MRLSHLILTLSSLAVGGVAVAALGSAPQDMPSPAVKQHKQIQRGVGSWEGTITMHMPDMPEPMTLPCTEVVRSVGDLWTLSRFEMDMMGTPFTGSSTFGYDKHKQKYVGTWIDSMSTGVTLMEGDLDKERKVIVMHYDQRDEASGATRKMRSETAHDGDSMNIKFFEVADGGDRLQMEIAMTRKGGGGEGR